MDKSAPEWSAHDDPRRGTTLAARTIQLRAQRRLDGPTRLEMACRMSDDARSVSEAGIRHRHPEWSDREIQRALLVLLLGPELAKRVLDPP